VLSSQTIEVEVDEGDFRVYAPVSNRGEAIGLLELGLAEWPDEATLADVALAAQMLAYVVIANRRFTDLYTWGQRSVLLTLAAEIQHRLLPGAYTCEAGEFTLAAWLEPSGNVGGDTFDFSLERDTLHLSITDAMGHALESAVLATVFIGALRNARRANVTLEQQVGLASRSLRNHTRGHAFVTGQVVRIDLTTGGAKIVNAGHPRPFRLRAGRVQELPLTAEPPFGLLDRRDYAVQEFMLEPGDRLMFFTDGVIERDAANFDLAGLVADGADMHPREAVQHVSQGFLGALGGELSDDATALCVDWHGYSMPPA
jgi:serine phosphatase RsbU (regulator of sigma subunit)